MFLKYNIYILDIYIRKQSSAYITDLIGFPEKVNIPLISGDNFN